MADSPIDSTAAAASAAPWHGHGAALRPAGTREVLLRVLSIALVLVRRLPVAAWQTLSSRMPLARRHVRHGDDWLVSTITELGPAFIKVAQMLSTRADLLPEHRCRELAALYDTGPPIPLAELEAALVSSLDATTRTAVLASAGKPLAAGSIACVYRAVLPDGSEVAVKVRRPGIEHSLRVDMTIMRWAARGLSRLPWLRGVPFAEIITQLTAAVYAQLDFEQERVNLALLRDHLAGRDGIRIPAVHEELSSGNVLVMEFIPGLRRDSAAEMTEVDRVGAVTAALRAVYQMLFLDGLVHCDLHPGNLYLGPGAGAVIVDAGFTVRLSVHAQDRFSSFFYYMSVGRGEACADVVLSTVEPGPATDVDGFRNEIRALIDANTGVPAAEFDLVGFATQLFAIQRRYGLYADPQFVFPILSLLVMEGTIRDYAPGIDFQGEAVPFLAKNMIARRLQIAKAEQHTA
ncbi:AarF/UbiB family protein [Haloechinothrix sp. LS1_15]|uniref:ABC1 kinase family protein n=1 Tax=Haloechinothrix sp. LS1_15 TaxID=2652248 RepID=UPI00294B2382|nr:AarF/UbiB family protein [Haloechinothrix sp. LS1_15]